MLERWASVPDGERNGKTRHGCAYFEATLGRPRISSANGQLSNTATILRSIDGERSSTIMWTVFPAAVSETHNS